MGLCGELIDDIRERTDTLGYEVKYTDTSLGPGQGWNPGRSAGHRPGATLNPNELRARSH